MPFWRTTHVHKALAADGRRWRLLLLVDRNVGRAQDIGLVDVYQRHQRLGVTANFQSIRRDIGQDARQVVGLDCVGELIERAFDRFARCLDEMFDAEQEPRNEQHDQHRHQGSRGAELPIDDTGQHKQDRAARPDRQRVLSQVVHADASGVRG